MDSQLLLVGLLLLSAGGMWLIAASVYRRRGSEPGMYAFAALTALFGGIAAALALVFVGDAVNLEQSLLYVLFSTFTAIALVAAVPWLVFVLQYTGRAELLTRPRIGLLFVPGLLHVALVFAMALRWSPSDADAWDGSYSALDLALWNTSFFTQLFLVGLIVVGGLLLLRTTYAYSHMSTAMGGLLALPVLVIVPLITFLPQVTSQAGVEVGGGLVGVCLLLGVGCFGVVLRRDDAFGSSSAAAGPVGRETILEQQSTAVFTLDNEHRVVEFNETARETFDLSAQGPLGEPIEDVLEKTVEELTTDATLNVRTVDDLWSETTVFLDTTEGRRRFDTEVTDLTDAQGRQLGVVVDLEDVTQRALREQRIGILNRVLRHNLRNKLSIVRGHAEMAPDAEGGIQEYMDAIDAAASDLLALGERARDVERVLAVEEEGSAPVEDVTESVLERLQSKCDETAFEASVEDDYEVTTTQDALEYVLAELCENAAKHNDASDPRVTIRSEREGDWVEIAVVDNGPALSQQELVAIRDEAESPLKHGSGLGLWSVRWIVTAFGGEIDVADNEPRGTVVTIRLPVADAEAIEEPGGSPLSPEELTAPVEQ